MPVNLFTNPARQLSHGQQDEYVYRPRQQIEQSRHVSQDNHESDLDEFGEN